MGQKYTEMVTAGAQEVETQKSNFVSASLPFHVLSKEIGGCTTLRDYGSKGCVLSPEEGISSLPASGWEKIYISKE